MFSEGFKSIQTKLEEKFYTSVSEFSSDLAAVFSDVIGFTTITNVVDAENQLSGVEHSSLTPEQKEKKKLAKRIIKAIQHPLEDATRREAELVGRPLEREPPNLEALLDQTLQVQAQRTPVKRSSERDAVVNGEVEQDDDADHEMVDIDDLGGENKDDDTIHLAPTPDDNTGGSHLERHDEAADEAAIAAQLGQDTIQLITNGAPEDSLMAEPDEGQAQASGNGTEPLTPPRSEKNPLAPLAAGGVPWYMEPFDIVGTTVHEERWTGREVLRDMSEELSELDDDEINDLADPDEVFLQPTTEDAAESVQKAAASRKQKKRWRGFK